MISLGTTVQLSISSENTVHSLPPEPAYWSSAASPVHASLLSPWQVSAQTPSPFCFSFAPEACLCLTLSSFSSSFLLSEVPLFLVNETIQIAVHSQMCHSKTHTKTTKKHFSNTNSKLTSNKPGMKFPLTFFWDDSNTTLNSHSSKYLANWWQFPFVSIKPAKC